MKLFFLLKLKINNYKLSKNHRQKKNINNKMNFLAKIERMKQIGKLINTKMKNIKII